MLVKPGDAVKAEDSLVTLESDKATMDVPSPVAGVVKEVKVKVGDKVSEGTLILTLEAERGRAATPPRRRRPRRQRRSPPARGGSRSRARRAPPAPAAPGARRPRAYTGQRRRRMRDARAGLGPGRLLGGVPLAPTSA